MDRTEIFILCVCLVLALIGYGATRSGGISKNSFPPVVEESVSDATLPSTGLTSIGEKAKNAVEDFFTGSNSAHDPVISTSLTKIFSPQSSALQSVWPVVGEAIPATLPGSGIDSTFENMETDTSAFYKMVTDGGINLLRFVPGITANYTHLLEGNGLGVLQSEVNAFNASPQKDPEASWTTTLSYRFYDKYIKLLQNTGSVGMISLNIMTQGSAQEAIGENLAILSDAQAKGVKIVSVQLGAENHLGSEDMRAVYPTVADYITRAKPVALAIRAAYPSITITVHPALPTKAGRGKDWNEGLGADSSWYDGVIMYAWIRPEDVDCSGLTKAAYACMDIYSDTFRHVTLPASLDSMRSLFPGKSIWIGQYNISTRNFSDTPGGGSTDVTFNNSMLHAIHVADFLLTLAEYDAKHGAIVKNASFMNFGGGGSIRNMIGDTIPNSSDSGHVVMEGSGKGAFVKREPWQAYALLRDLFDGTYRLVASPVQSTTAGFGSIVRAYAFANPTGGLRMYIINRGGSNIPLTSFSIGGVPLIGTGVITSKDMHGTSLTSTYGEKGHGDLFTPIVVEGVTSYITLEEVMIRPYSITEITIGA